jgi:ferrous iron transport protein A
MQDLIPLRALAAGQSAEVRQIIGQADQVRRLEELGLRDGAQLKMVRSGTPCIVRLGSSTLCFRDVEALQVMVRPTKVSA